MPLGKAFTNPVSCCTSSGALPCISKDCVLMSCDSAASAIMLNMISRRIVMWAVIASETACSTYGRAISFAANCSRMALATAPLN